VAAGLELPLHACDEVLRFECGEKFSGIAYANCGIQIEVMDQIFHHVIDRVPIIEQLPDATAAFIQLEVYPLLDVKKKRLVADRGGNDFR